MNIQFEQRINIKFCVMLSNTATETMQLLRDAYGDEALSLTRVFEWHRRFVSCRVLVEDDTRSGRPSSSRKEYNVVRIRDMVREDRSVTVRMLADYLNISKSTCHQILREDFGKRKLNARLVPHALTQDQKEMRASICADLLHEAQNDSTFVNCIIAEDES
jgi:AraC-like DNA-binding protein